MALRLEPVSLSLRLESRWLGADRARIAFASIIRRGAGSPVAASVCPRGGQLGCLLAAATLAQKNAHLSGFGRFSLSSPVSPSSVCPTFRGQVHLARLWPLACKGKSRHVQRALSPASADPTSTGS